MKFSDLFYGLGNAAQFTPLQGEWIQLSPYGEFPHVHGLQLMTRTAAEEMVKTFNSFVAKLARAFGGAPFYLGHPDVPGSSNFGEDRAYGWIQELDARPDGFYGRVKWTEEGEKLVNSGAYKFYSPFWECRHTGNRGSRKLLSPERLISAGLTNNPNIPVLSLSNCKCQETEKTPSKSKKMNEEQLRAHLRSLLALDNTADDTAIESAIYDLSKDAPNTALATRLRDALANVKTASDKVTQTDVQLAAITKERDDLKAANTAERKDRIELIVDSAISDGRVTAAEAKEWRVKLSDPAQFVAANSALASLASKINTGKSITSNLGGRKGETNHYANMTDRTTRVNALVSKYMQEMGVDYDTAFAAVRTANASLFDQMQQPAKP